MAMSSQDFEIGRRGVIGAGLAGLAGLAGAASLLGSPARALAEQAASTIAPSPVALPRNLIFIVPDGMSTGAISLLDVHSTAKLGRRPFWHTLRSTAGVHHATHTCYAHESLVTDSAAASSAWSTGILHKLKAICITPDGRRPLPIFIRAKAQGFAVGFVTTTTITHATPAGFYCNAMERGDEAGIAAQLIERGIDVAIGGGGKFVDKAFAEGAMPADSKVAGRGPIVARTMDGLRAAMNNPAASIIGVLDDSHIPYVIDRRGEVRDRFDLAEAALMAAKRLASTGKPFMLQVEAGRIDHAGHNNDAAGLLGEMLEYDATLEAMVGFARTVPGTLVVTVADHATANPGLTRYGSMGSEGIAILPLAKRSFEWMVESAAQQHAKPVRGAALAAMAEAELGYKLPGTAAALLQSVYDAKPVDPFVARTSIYGVLGSLAGNTTSVGFVSVNHTADAVDLLAVGPGAETLPGLISNTQVHDWLAGLFKLASPLA